MIFPRHVEGEKLDRIVWNLSTFYAYVSYHIKVRALRVFARVHAVDVFFSQGYKTFDSEGILKDEFIMIFLQLPVL